MNSVPQHLLNEDRIAYERALDEELHSTAYENSYGTSHRNSSGTGATGHHGLNPEQLRTMALNASALITAAAATEYERYVRARDELRHPQSTADSPAVDTAGAAVAGQAEEQGGPGTTGLAAGAAEVVEGASAGVVAVVAVLAPMLAGAAAVIFLLVGYLLKAVSPQTAFAQTMVTTGWVFGALTALAMLLAAAGLLSTALRNASTSLPAEEQRVQLELVEQARQDWLQALTERGIRPFLAEAVTRPATAPSSTATTTPQPRQRMPQLGYHSPGFSSPDEGTATPPRYSSPDFSSPDFRGPRAPE